MSLRSRRPLGLLLGGMLGIIAVAAAVGALAGSEDRPSGAGGGPSFASARDGVCQAADAARAGEAAAARAVFFDRSHQALHELAAAVQERDRPAAARLLEAKARVESGLDRPGATLAQDLETLAVATGGAMAATGAGDPGPCRR